MKLFYFVAFIMLSILNAHAASIKIHVKECKMTFNHNNQTKEYVVGTVKPGLPVPKDIGYVTKVDLNPYWYPTKRTKDYFKEEKGIVLPDAVPPGHPQNYMGSFKITMTNKTSRGAIYRIHGNKDASTIGKRSSGGCVRMHNKEGKEFAIMIKELLNKGEKITVEYV